MSNLFRSTRNSAWCPGCGNFSIITALTSALDNMGLKPSDVYLISGIGQAAKMPHYLTTNGFNTLHGRALPVAMGAVAAKSSQKIIVASGDGDTYGEGGNHFLHFVRRNLDILHMVHDNQVYGLTKGQASPTTPLGQITTLQSDGAKSLPIRPVLLSLSLGASFVAQCYSGDVKMLQELIERGLQHKGYALINILQTCISFNKVNTPKWYQDHLEPITDHDPSDLEAAMKLAMRSSEKLPVGVFYEASIPTFMDRQPHLDRPLLSYERKPEDIKKLF